MNFASGRSTGRAFTFAGLLVILAVVAMLAAMLLPALARAKSRSSRVGCVQNLKQDALAFRMWGQDNYDKFPMAVSTNKQGTMEFVAGGNAFRHFQVMSNEMGSPKILVCPTDNRTAAARFSALSNENLSYFVGLDANDTKPQMFLAGDRNITNGISPRNTILELRPERAAGWTETMHNGQGNVALVDGSVQGFSTSALRQALKVSGDTTNRIALPE